MDIIVWLLERVDIPNPEVIVDKLLELDNIDSVFLTQFCTRINCQEKLVKHLVRMNENSQLQDLARRMVCDNT